MKKQNTKKLKRGAAVRSSELVRCAFTESEAGHILSLIAGNERNGEHTAPREQYWKRSERIKSKLLKCNVRRTPNSELSGGGPLSVDETKAASRRPLE